MPWEKYDVTPSSYDPGQVVIFFDNRMFRSQNDQFSSLQSRWMAAKYKLGWPSLWTQELEPGKIRIVWYTHAGAEGKRDFPLHKAYAVLEMFEMLSTEGFRPMVLGWSAENPFPMIGGAEPPPEPKKEQPRIATSWSATSSGRGQAVGVWGATGQERANRQHNRALARGWAWNGKDTRTDCLVFWKS